MKKFTMDNLTPELMKQLPLLTTKEKVLEFAKENGLEITDEKAAKLAERIARSTELSKDDLKSVSGGTVVKDTYRWVPHIPTEEDEDDDDDDDDDVFFSQCETLTRFDRFGKS